MDTFKIFDMETDGLYDDVSMIHCLSYQILRNREIIDKGTLTKKEEIREFFNDDTSYFVCHNLIRYDIPVARKFFTIPETIKRIDTLGLSWYLFPLKKKHGLEVWGNDVGVPKPVIEDWKNDTLEAYINRCETDVEINVRIFIKMMDYLMSIYQDYDQALRMINYLNFKLDCLWDQESSKITLNVGECEQFLKELETMFDEKTTILSRSMPSDLGKIVKSKPKICYKKDGNLSVHGERWFSFLEEEGLPEDTELVREVANPGSTDQLKAWLSRLDWRPITFKENKKGDLVPQVSLPFGAGLCESIKDLYDDEPALEELDNYYRIKHRIGIFKSYLKNVDKNGKVYASANGLTKTMRMMHSQPIVNLPKPGTMYGQQIRQVLTIPDDSYIMCGSDVSSLEDSTKQHYIYFFDPDYVNEMRVPGFDPHVDIAELAGIMTKEEVHLFKYLNHKDECKIQLSDLEKADFKALKKKRGTGKTTNFAATYGAGGPKIAETSKVSLQEGYRLHGIYWTRNAAVKETAKACTVKTVQTEIFYMEDFIADYTEEGEPIIEKRRSSRFQGQKWLYNPISRFWMFLSAEKDRFSALNQSTGVFVFDSWLRKVREKLKDTKVVMQYHDELLIICKKELKDYVENVLRSSMMEVNKDLKLNVNIDISVDWGTNYAECH